MGHFVYRYTLNGEILYVGKNDTDLISRIEQHEQGKGDKLYHFQQDHPDLVIDYIEVGNSSQSDVMETYLIDKLRPKFNSSKKFDGTAELFGDIPLPEFKPYKDLLNRRARKTKNASTKITKVKPAMPEWQQWSVESREFDEKQRGFDAEKDAKRIQNTLFALQYIYDNFELKLAEIKRPVSRGRKINWDVGQEFGFLLCIDDFPYPDILLDPDYCGILIVMEEIRTLRCCEVFSLYSEVRNKNILFLKPTVDDFPGGTGEVVLKREDIPRLMECVYETRRNFCYYSWIPMHTKYLKTNMTAWEYGNNWISENWDAEQKTLFETKARNTNRLIKFIIQHYDECDVSDAENGRTYYIPLSELEETDRGVPQLYLPTYDLKDGTGVHNALFQAAWKDYDSTGMRIDDRLAIEDLRRLSDFIDKTGSIFCPIEY